MKRAGRSLVFLACILFTVSAAYNVFSDNVEVVGMAWNAACKNEGSNCDTLKERRPQEAVRTPFAQTFKLNTPKGRLVEVRCARSLVLFGDYSCTLQ